MPPIQMPNNWKSINLVNIAEVKYGKARPKESGNIPVIGSGGIYAQASKALIDFPTIVIGRKGTAGIAWLQEGPCWASDTTFYLNWKNEMVDYHYLYYYFQFRPLSGEHARTTLPSLLKQDLENYPLLIPPLPEQRAISHVLRTVQQAKETRLNEIALERERKAALMGFLFTHGTMGEPTKQTEIGEMPESWKVSRLGDIITLHRGFDLPQKDRLPGNVPIISSSGLTGTHAKAKIKGPGVVTGRYGTIGEVFYISQDFWPLNTTLFVSEFNGNYPLFISYFLQTINLSSFNDKTSVPGINRNHVHAQTVRLPTIQEQQAIAKNLILCDSKIVALEHEATLLDELFKAMLEELMTGRLPSEAVVGKGQR